MEILRRVTALQRHLEQLTNELANTNRRLDNIVRLGVVAAVRGSVVDVKTGANIAKDVPFFVHAAGRVRHYRQPTAGEQCILINLGSGDNLSNAVALMGLASDTFPLPTLSEKEVMTDYGNGMTETYNLDSGSMYCIYPGGMTLIADLTHIGNQEHTGNLNRTGDSIFTGQLISTGSFNHMGGFAVASAGRGGDAATFAGSLNVTGGDVTVDGYSVKLHFHTDAENRATSEAKK